MCCTLNIHRCTNIHRGIELTSMDEVHCRYNGYLDTERILSRQREWSVAEQPNGSELPCMHQRNQTNVSLRLCALPSDPATPKNAPE